MSFGSRKKGQRERNNMQTLSLFDFLIATPTAPSMNWMLPSMIATNDAHSIKSYPKTVQDN